MAKECQSYWIIRIRRDHRGHQHSLEMSDRTLTKAPQIFLAHDADLTDIHLAFDAFILSQQGLRFCKKR